jgi:hypothetical protein
LDVPPEVAFIVPTRITIVMADFEGLRRVIVFDQGPHLALPAAAHDNHGLAHK